MLKEAEGFIVGQWERILQDASGIGWTLPSTAIFILSQIQVTMAQDTDLSHLKIQVLTWQQLDGVFIRTEKVTNQGAFKISLWDLGKGSQCPGVMV